MGRSMRDVGVILPAAGRSVRFGSDKLRAVVGGRRVIDRTIDVFLGHAQVGTIVVVTNDSTLIDVDGYAEGVRIRVVTGGSNRAESVRCGLRALPESIEWALIHDAARPLLSVSLIDDVLRAARKYGAAAPAMPVALTVKRAVRVPGPIEQTVPREHLWAMQTPQIARRADLLEAFDRCPIPTDQVTDDLQLLELIGRPSHLVPGDERNLKLTTPIDLQLAELLLASETHRKSNGAM